jgi:hypothetical protein
VITTSLFVVDYFKDNYPFHGRAAKCEQGIKDLLSLSQTILNEKLHGGKQTTLDSFFKQSVKE